MKYCSQCGKPLQEDSRFCSNCGAPRPAQVPQPSMHPMQPPVYRQSARKPAGAKKWVVPVVLGGAVLMVLVLAVGILAIAGGIARNVVEDEPVSQIQLNPDLTPVKQVRRDQVGYVIVRQDDSLRNSNGDVIVRIEYDQVVVDEQWEELEKINEYIEQDYRNFVSVIRNAYGENSGAEIERFLIEAGMEYDSLFWTAGVEVTTNGDGILSLRYSTGWFLGGVFNGDHYGMIFDLDTGRALSLAELTDMSETELKAALVDSVCKALEPEREYLFSDPADVLANYELEDYLFFVENGEIVLEFPTYTFGPGAMGSTTVRTGIRVGS